MKRKGRAMRILVLNSGSSSIKVSMFDAGTEKSVSGPRAIYDGELSGIGGPHARLEIRGVDGADLGGAAASQMDAATTVHAIRLVLDAVCGPQMPTVQAVGYRVVHPGAKLGEHQRITDAVLADLEEAVVFAPLHNPAVVAVIREGMKRFPDVAHYACFDTSFHRTMPEEATTYPIPQAFRDKGVRRYGFHGLSVESIVRQMRAVDAVLPKRMAIAHLGSGCSVTALVDGSSVDTTMGLTPTGGVVMGTRPGDLDPGLVLYLLRQQEAAKEEAISDVQAILNQRSGMVALSGMPNDVKALRQAAATGDSRAALALKVFTHSVKKAVGGFCWLLGGLDAIVFSGGIGEHDALTRSEILSGLEGLEIFTDPSLNEERRRGLRKISTSHSRTAIFVVPSQEDLMIAVHVNRMARSIRSSDDR
jgi:acetate kinase